MCYFVEINLPRKELEERFGVPMIKDPRYMPGVFLSAFNLPYLPVISSEKPEVISFSQWGLIPFWVKEGSAAEKIRMSTFNAKSETIWNKPAFRAAARYRRCLVLSHGFFEYHSIDKFKIPFYIRRKDGRPFAFAGLSDSWTDPDSGEIVESCSIITVPANPMLEKIHNIKKRMPAILEESVERQWLDPGLKQQELSELLQPCDEKELEAQSISKDIIKQPPGSKDVSVLNPVEYSQLKKLF